jgi:hypothetical protein
MRNEEWEPDPPNLHSTFGFLHSFDGADGETCTLVGRGARQFTKLLLSLLSHVGEMVGRHGAAPCSAV